MDCVGYSTVSGELVLAQMVLGPELNCTFVVLRNLIDISKTVEQHYNRVPSTTSGKQLEPLLEPQGS